MSAGIYNFTLEQGATFTRTITVRNPDGTLRDLTGYSAKMQLRKDYDSTTVTVELSSANTRITLGDAAGTIGLYIDPTTTATITKDSVYDLELVDPGGEIERLLEGYVRLKPEVTR